MLQLCACALALVWCIRVWRDLLNRCNTHCSSVSFFCLGTYALAHAGPHKFHGKPKAVAVQPGYFAPLSLGSTAYSAGALWGLPLLAGPNEALAPAWRSLWVQKLLWDVGGQLLVQAPSARQNRYLSSAGNATLPKSLTIVHFLLVAFASCICL